LQIAHVLTYEDRSLVRRCVGNVTCVGGVCVRAAELCTHAGKMVKLLFTK